jgi:hypothetical protein
MTAAKEADLAGPGIGDYAELERVLSDDSEPRLSQRVATSTCSSHRGPAVVAVPRLKSR